jgi:[acyl-carrier-protein] S-malonyltransferase
MVAPLPVSAPFHCTLMQPAADALERVLVETAFSTPRLPVYANVDASRIDDGDAARRLLIRQVVSPVRWIDVVEAMLADGIRTFLEVGPGKVLAGLVRRIDRGVRVLPVSDEETARSAVAALQEDG